jgi:hypothetical protein
MRAETSSSPSASFNLDRNLVRQYTASGEWPIDYLYRDYTEALKANIRCGVCQQRAVYFRERAFIHVCNDCRVLVILGDHA